MVFVIMLYLESVNKCFVLIILFNYYKFSRGGIIFRRGYLI